MQINSDENSKRSRQAISKVALVVDDEQSMQKSLGRLLRAMGFTVHFASGGEEAGRKYSDCKPHLMCLDLQMRDVNGIQVLRNISRDRLTKILIISAGSEAQLSEALSEGADAILQKPFEINEFEALVGGLTA